MSVRMDWASSASSVFIVVYPLRYGAPSGARVRADHTRPRASRTRRTWSGVLGAATRRHAGRRAPSDGRAAGRYNPTTVPHRAAGPEIRPRPIDAYRPMIDAVRQHARLAVERRPAAPSRSGRRSAVRTQRLVATPARDPAVIAGAQHLGHRRGRATRAASCRPASPAGRRRATRRPATRRCRARRASAGSPPRASRVRRPRRRTARSRRARPRSPRSRVAASSSTRWSMPSYRPQAKIRWLSAARSAASAWVNGTPAGLGTISAVRVGRRRRAPAGRRAPRPTARAASPCRGRRRTAVSSTVRCTSCVHRRRSCTASSSQPGRARLAEQRQVERREVLRKDRDDVDLHAGAPHRGSTYRGRAGRRAA